MVAIPIIAVSVTIDDPGLMRRYGDYIAAVKRAGGKGTKRINLLQQRLESNFAFLSASINSGAGNSEIRNPDFAVTPGTEFDDALASIFGTQITEIEAKLKATNILETTKGGNFRSGTKIGTSFKGRGRAGSLFTESILEQVKVTAKEEQIKNNTTNEDNPINLFDDLKIRKQLNANNGKKLFKVIQSDSRLYNRFFRKSTTLQFVNKLDKKLAITTIKFSKNKFKIPPFKFRVDKDGGIRVVLNTTFEKQLLTAITKAHRQTIAFSVQDYMKGVIDIGKGKAAITVAKLNEIPINILTQVPTGGSIPMGRGLLQKRDTSLRKKAGQRNRRRRQGVGNAKLITTAQFSAVLRARIAKIGPFGPIGGKANPTSTRLTHRTGRYLRSINITSLDFRKRLITYWYDPIYFVHEETIKSGQRDPRDVIETSIRTLAVQYLGIAVEPIKLGN